MARQEYGTAHWAWFGAGGLAVGSAIGWYLLPVGDWLLALRGWLLGLGFAGFWSSR